ncbi:unnamed protein product [Rotaria socialis]|uniref:BTB domain-containing protein n=1 Tax=Rotaria socialis TaxID=392032 RepID=A0A820GKI7_9BILA|nr:unnamed protein product [Rotaria socialis]CAF3759912.1 unnamed protein product [Rotaria socialis]CAF4278689.1 unnamed protein product [Rotaria socialis]CAF4693560.1 unnamed protein product [Rotaria socialis]
MPNQTVDIINLNVGGQRFSTSRQTLTWISDSFFTAMLNGLISTNRDDQGYIFIDRDPKLFSIILNYLRTKELDINGCDLHMLKHECEFYGVQPLIRRLQLCEDLEHSQCGDVLFNGYINPPHSTNTQTSCETTQLLPCQPIVYQPVLSQPASSVRPGTALRLTNIMQQTLNRSASQIGDFRTSSSDFVPMAPSASSVSRGHSRASSTDSVLWTTHQPNTSSHVRQKSAAFIDHHPPTPSSPVASVILLAGHHNWISAAYSNNVVMCYKMKDTSGWQIMFESEVQSDDIYRLAITARSSSSAAASQQTQESTSNIRESKLLGIAVRTNVRLWNIVDASIHTILGTFAFGGPIDNLFFINSQLVATGDERKVGVWHSISQQWQTQELTRILSFDTAGTFLLLGSETGSIYYFDMQKFPLRMKDNDLLITEIFKDPAGESITALSVYLTPKTSVTGNWIEIAYGTNSGIIRIVVQHPETVGHGPQLFQTFCVHRSPVTKIMLSERHLISVCASNNHVRTWNVTRFRGMISTQPGSTPLASYRIVSIEPARSIASYTSGNDIGPYGDRDDQQVFVQKVVPFETNQIYVRFCSTGKRVAIVRSVDSSPISCFTIHECEGPSRLSTRPRRFIFTGHDNGSIQLFDLTTAIELSSSSDVNSLTLSSPPSQNNQGGPSPADLLKMLDHCDFAVTNGQNQNFLSSRCSTPCCMSNNLPITTVNYTTALISSPLTQPATKEDNDKHVS